MKLRPLHDRVNFKRLDPERNTSTCRVIPEYAVEQPYTVEPLAVGTGKGGAGSKGSRSGPSRGD